MKNTTANPHGRNFLTEYSTAPNKMNYVSSENKGKNDLFGVTMLTKKKIF